MLHRRGDRRRVLLVGAGRAGRSLVREFREDPDARVVGFLDDNPALRRRRVQGVTVLGTTDEVETVLVTARPDEVLVSIPNAPRNRLDVVVRACAEAQVPCRFVRRRTETQTPLLEVAAE
jgi:FlaA1/EpsC-like NDP-sugar epimerase